MTTASTQFFQGIPLTVPNTCIENIDEDFYISYNNYDTYIYGCDTTALVKGQMQHFYILNGDHRAEYNTLMAKGFNACLDYFKANSDKKNQYSEDVA